VRALARMRDPNALLLPLVSSVNLRFFIDPLNLLSF
jgi:hypothetical protein